MGGNRLYSGRLFLNHPRLAALYNNSWQKNLPKDFIGTFRHPITIVDSLQRKYHFSYDKSVGLCKIYQYKLISFLKKYDGLFAPNNTSHDGFDILYSELNKIFVK